MKGDPHICKTCVSWHPDGDRATAERAYCDLDGKTWSAGGSCVSWKADWHWAHRPLDGRGKGNA